MAQSALSAEHGRMARPPQRPSAGRQPRRPRPNYIRLWREARGLTLEQLAEKSGVSAPTISQVENLKSGYSWRSLEDIAEALDCSPGDLLSRPPDAVEIDDLLGKLSAEDRSKVVGVIRVITGKN